jgi:hypothetical protein
MAQDDTSLKRKGTLLALPLLSLLLNYSHFPVHGDHTLGLAVILSEKLQGHFLGRTQDDHHRMMVFRVSSLPGYLVGTTN